MMNLTVNRDDYTEYAEFMLQLKKALSYKGNLFAKQAVHSLDVSKMYKTLLPDYLYYRLFDNIGDPVDPLVSTYIINVEEIGGSGAYYIKHGKYRKDTNTVEFKVYPPVGLNVHGVSINNSKLISYNDNEYSFIMPENDVNIRILYSETQPMKQVVYFGYNIETLEQMYSGSTLLIDPTGEFTIPFENIGLPGYIWFATKRDITKQTQNIGGEFDIFDTFELFGIFTEYNVYRHLWPTEIDKITFE
jgi:hypothetical protein